MPWRICELGNNRYEVINCITGESRAKNTTLEKAQAQLRILNKEYENHKTPPYECTCGCFKSRIMRKTTSDRSVNKAYETPNNEY